MVGREVRSFHPAQVALQGVTLGMARAEIDYLFCTPRLDGEGAPAHPISLSLSLSLRPKPNPKPKPNPSPNP